MKSFDDLHLSPTLMSSLKKMQYIQPTPIQAQAIPPALQGKDIMGSAQTGTGKTAAFAIPLVEALLRSPRGSALVLTPTRELGRQIMEIMHQLLGKKTAIKTAFLIGGEPMGKQLNQLRQRPRLIVGTPGRINDHLERGTLMLHDTGFLVLDETDRMLDMGFSIQLDRIFKFLPAKRQTLMFSATLPDNIVKMSKKYLQNPSRIAVGSTVNPAKNIKQEVIRVSTEEKYTELTKQLKERDGTIIVFVKTKRNTEKLAKKLSSAKFDARAIHGDLRQNARDRLIRDLRSMKYRILVATDVVARGLDIPHIEHVINYDLPQVPEDYIHRIGRTARAGASGEAICLITPHDRRQWNEIECLMDPDKKPEQQNAGQNRKKKPFRKWKNKSNNKKGGFNKSKKSFGNKGGNKGGNKNGNKDGANKNNASKGKKPFKKRFANKNNAASNNKSGNKKANA